MRDPEQDITCEDFANHSAWVRRLARRLLDDDGQADDLTQEAWLVLRRQPAGTIADLRAWLGGVVRRIARRTREREVARRDASRRAAERGELAPPRAPSTEQVLEAEATRRAVVEAVLSLDEPYRSTLLLHFYEELPPNEIARRLDVPGSTVRTRLQRGLARVRAKLGERDPRGEAGMRASLWILADGLRTSSTPIGKGMLVASTSSKFAGVGLAFVLLGVGTWWYSGSSSELRAPLETERTTITSSDDGTRTNPQPDNLAAAHDQHERVGIADTPAPTDDRWHLAIRRSIGSIRGTVVGKDDGLPAANVEVSVVTSTGLVARHATLADDRESIERRMTTRADGHFLFEALPTGAYRLKAVGPLGMGAEEQVTATVDDVALLVALETTATRSDRIRTLTALAVDENGRPVADAKVELKCRDGDGREMRRSVITDARGRALFDALDLRVGILVASTPDGRIAREHVQAGSSAHFDWLRVRHVDHSEGFVSTIVLRATGSIEGVVTKGAGSTVHVWMRGAGFFGGGLPARDSATCDRDGAFAIHGLSAGSYVLTIDAPLGQRADVTVPSLPARMPKSALVPTYVDVVAGTTSSVRARLTPSSIVEGRVVHDETGDPIANATVRAWIVRPSNPDPGGTRRGNAYTWHLGPSTEFDEWGPTMRFETRTDAEGRYRLSGLAPTEPWALEVQSANLERAFVDPLNVVDGETLALEHRLSRAGGIQGTAWAHATIGIHREGEARCVDAVSLPAPARSTFTVTGLAPGRYELRARHWSDADRNVPLTTVEVRAGELTHVDLSACAPHVAAGRVLRGGVPVADAVVDLREPVDQHLRTTTDADGRFTFRFAFANPLSSILDVLAPNLEGAVRTSFEVSHFMNGDQHLVHELEMPDGEVVVEVVDGAGLPLSAIIALEPVRGPNWGEKHIASFVNRSSMSRGSAGETASTDRVNTTVQVITKNTTRRSTDGAGRARFTCLPPGRLQVSAETEHGWSIAPVEVDIVLGSTARVELCAPERGRVRARIVDGVGNPLVGAIVHVVITSDEREFALARPRLTNELGDVEFPNVVMGRARVRAMTQEPNFMQRRGAHLDIDVVPSTVTHVTLTIP